MRFLWYFVSWKTNVSWTFEDRFISESSAGEFLLFCRIALRNTDVSNIRRRPIAYVCVLYVCFITVVFCLPTATPVTSETLKSVFALPLTTLALSLTSDTL